MTFGVGEVILYIKLSQKIKFEAGTSPVSLYLSIEIKKSSAGFARKEGSALEKIIERLRTAKRRPNVVVGFDGYVDSILRVCRQTGDAETEFFNTMEEFGSYIKGKSWKSCSLELKLQTEKPGGNAPIFSQTMACLGAHVSCIGAFGTPRPLPIFRELEQRCTLYSLCGPGLCEALEFRDGKLMLARNDRIKVDYQSLTKLLPVPRLLEMMEEAELLAFFNWSELPGSTSIWQGCLRDVFPKLTARKRLMHSIGCQGIVGADQGFSYEQLVMPDHSSMAEKPAREKSIFFS